MPWLCSKSNLGDFFLLDKEYGPHRDLQYSVEQPASCEPNYVHTVLDAHPTTLAWLGAVRGHRVRALGVEHFGQTGSLVDLYRHYGIDADPIMAAAQAVAAGRPIRHLRAL